MSNWISVKDRLPKSRDWYLTYTNGFIAILFFDGVEVGGEKIYWLESGDWEGNVTHWAPLPAPPEDK